MTIHSVFDPAFAPYGKVLEGYDTAALTALNGEDELLTACNKWLLAHPDSSEAKSGAKVGLRGENIDIANLL